jgi:hypothetical protein
MSKSIFAILLLVISAAGCAPRKYSADINVTDIVSGTEIVTAIESSSGSVERDSSGKITGVDLAKDRTSASDEVLRQVLKLPDLKRLRLAGGNTLPETFAGISNQKSLEELYLQDLSISGEKLEAVLMQLPKLQRLTLRRLTAVSVLSKLPALRNLALIEMNVTEQIFRSIIEQKSLIALDIRNCSGLTPNDYRNLKSLTRLVDLKIGGFNINDEILEAMTPIPNLTGLTIDDAFISPDGFAQFASDSPSAATLETLILNRDTTIMDNALISTLKKFPKLKRLTVCGMMVTGHFLTQLAEDEVTRPKLKQLSLRKTLLKPEDAEALKKYRELRSLDLSGVGLNTETVEIIASLDSLEELNVRDCSFDGDIVAVFQKMKSLKKLFY